jgi:GBP family porin
VSTFRARNPIIFKGYELNKKLIGIGMLLAANGAFAQSSSGGSSIEIYGILDVGVGYVEHSLSIDPNFPFGVNPVTATKTSVGNSASGMVNGGLSDSRWGLRGTEDLGGGMKAFFVLEQGFNVPNGNLNNGAQSLANNTSTAPSSVSANTSLNGQMFNRQANVGLSDATFGTISAGRNYAPIYDIVVAYDPVSAADLFSPLGFSGGFGGGGGVSEDLRIDNSIKYKNKIGDVNFGAFYKFGGVSGSTSAEGGYGANIGYENGPFGIQAAVQTFTDALKTGNSAVSGQISVTDYNTSAYFIAAKYQFGDATVRGGYESYTLKPPSDSFASLGLTSLYGYTVASSTTFSKANQGTDIWFIGGDYNFSPALNLALGYYDVHLKQSGDSAQLDGNQYYYSALLDYHFSKRTDVYGGMMYAKFDGPQYPSATFNQNNEVVAVGIRHKF